MPTQQTPSSSASPTGSGGGRRGLLIAIAVVVVIAVVITAFLLGHRAAVNTKATAPATSSATVPTDDVEMREVAGVLLPFSATNGPRITSNGRAAGYSQSEQGAAIAAVQVLARTSPSAGSHIFVPVLTSQVTGNNLLSMKLAVDDEYQRLRATTSVKDGEPIPGNDAQVAGYLIHSYGETAAKVDVVLNSVSLSNSGQLVSFGISLVWQSDDWRVVAPPNGDWGLVATTLGDPPAGLQKYET